MSAIQIRRSIELLESIDFLVESMADALTDMEQELKPGSDARALAQEIAQSYELDPARLLDTFIKKNGDPTTFPERRAEHERISRNIDSRMQDEKSRDKASAQEQDRRRREALLTKNMDTWTSEQWDRYEARERAKDAREERKQEREDLKSDKENAKQAAQAVDEYWGNYFDFSGQEMGKRILSGEMTKEAFIETAKAAGGDAIWGAIDKARQEYDVNDEDLIVAAFKKIHKQTPTEFGESVGEDFGRDRLHDVFSEAAQNGPNKDQSTEDYLKGLTGMKDLSDKDAIVRAILDLFGIRRNGSKDRLTMGKPEHYPGLVRAIKDAWPMHWAWFEKNLF